MSDFCNSSYNLRPRHNNKRKLADFNPTTATTTTTTGGNDSAVSTTRSPKIPNTTQNDIVSTPPPPTHIQFFVNMSIDGGKSKTLFIRLKSNDTVKTIYDKIETVTNIPVNDQRLIYRGKQLQFDKLIDDYSIEHDSVLQLVGRMQSTKHSLAWSVINDIVSLIFMICRNELTYFKFYSIRTKLRLYMSLSTGRENRRRYQIFNKIFSNIDDCKYDYEYEEVEEVENEAGVSVDNLKMIYHCKIFMNAYAPKALVMLYMSPSHKRNKQFADICIRSFVDFMKGFKGDVIAKVNCARVVLEFCKLLEIADKDGLLFVHCRSSLGSIVKDLGEVIRNKEIYNHETTWISIREVFPYLKDLGNGLVRGLGSILKSCTKPGLSSRDACDFSAFLRPVLVYIQSKRATERLEYGSAEKLRTSGEEVNYLSSLFNELIGLIDKCLNEMDKTLNKKRKKNNDELNQNGWSGYLPILEELNSISILFPGYENRFWTMMRRHKVAVQGLVIRYAKCSDEYGWLSKHKDLLDFECRKQIALSMFPEIVEDYEGVHQMLIDRSQLLAASFRYISEANSSSLHASLFMEFENEEATGPGVIREWFCLVCQAIFDPKNALFFACPADRQRFFPNPASKVNPEHLGYFRFTGRVIALALMHKIQVGVVLDRTFFLQLAGRRVNMEDIKDADPFLYKSCQQILEMDAKLVDSDCLGLTFSTEVEEFGSRKVVELCSGGKEIPVNSKNRWEYVQLIIQHRFVRSISEQVSSFVHGFSDILQGSKALNDFIGVLEPEDLDWMLRGSGSEICVEDWKAHTDYHGYKKSDREIGWFWKVVGKLNAEEKRNLLFFWTSVKYLPVDGFNGLASRLSIHNTLGSENRLPSSHTCFYELCLPPYRSENVMQKHLSVINQEHVISSFGTS